MHWKEGLLFGRCAPETSDDSIHTLLQLAVEGDRTILL